MNQYLIIVNENMHDAHARVVRIEDAFPLKGWEREWGAYPTGKAAEAALPEAKEYIKGRMLPG